MTDNDYDEMSTCPIHDCWECEICGCHECIEENAE